MNTDNCACALEETVICEVQNRYSSHAVLQTVRTGALHTRQITMTRVHLLSKQRVLRTSLRKKGEDCLDPNEEAMKTLNHDARDIIAAI